MTGISLVALTYTLLGILADTTIIQSQAIHYALRLLHQFFCFALAVSWAATYKISLFRCKTFNVYLLAIFLSSWVADSQAFVLLQFFSICSVVIFSVTITQLDDAYKFNLHRKIIDYTAHIYFITCIIGVALAYIAPRYTYYKDLYGEIARFSGIFSSSGVLGLVSGIVLGYGVLVGFGQQSMGRMRSLLYIGIACWSLLLALTRTHIIASVLAFSIIWFIYSKNKFRSFVLMFGAAVVMFTLYVAVQPSEGLIDYKKNTLLRLENISNAAGRTLIWDEALINFKRRPILGYGLARGGCASFSEQYSYLKRLDRDTESFAIAKDTCVSLHNGYIQAFLDLGIVGGCVYLFMIIYSISCCARYDASPEKKFTLFVLLFLSITNLGESVIFTTSLFPAILYLYFAAYSITSKSKNYLHKVEP